MQNSITMAKNFDINKIKFGEVKKLDNGGKYIPLLYNNEPFDLQTPECIAPYGLNTYNNEDDKKIDYSLSLSFKDKDTRKPLEKLYKCFKTIDKNNIDNAFENQLKWFKAKYNSRDVVKALYVSVIRMPKDKNGDVTDKYPPTFKVKIPQDSNRKIKCDVYDENRNKVNLLDLNMKGAKVTCIVRCGGIYIAGNRFGMTFNVRQMLVIPIARITGYCIRYIEEDMITSITNDKAQEKDEDEHVVIKQKNMITNIESSDDEDDEDDEDSDENSNIDEFDEQDLKEHEPEPEPVPDPKVVKKVTRKNRG